MYCDTSGKDCKKPPGEYQTPGGFSYTREGAPTVATSRTGTTSHKHWRTQILNRDRNQGITHCPLCNTPLDYTTSRQPNSAEPDHIIPHAFGGTNTLENGRTICRRCNQRRGALTGHNTARKHAKQTHYTTLDNTKNW